jgi:L-threonylcarbamoyladenylate synthase
MKEKEIWNAANIIKNGGIVAFPTETVYGLGANALNPFAVAKIFEAKERPSFDPLIVHIASIEELKNLTVNPSELVYQVAAKFWPGPLTIVLPKSNIIPDIVTSGLQTVGIRMPNNDIALELIKTSGCPIAAPSANKFGHLSPVSAYHVKKQLPNIDAILDGGNSQVGIESTIIAIENNICTLLRPGRITIQDIENAFPNTFNFKENNSDIAIAPGLLKSHYSPTKPLYLFDENTIIEPEQSGLISHQNLYKQPIFKRQIITSETNNLIEIAANLFSALHIMEDDTSIKHIYIEAVPEVGLGIAIMDRIKKAVYQYSDSANHKLS